MCGMDFPFGQPKSLSPLSAGPRLGGLRRRDRWALEGRVRGCYPGRHGARPPGNKWRYRLADRRCGSSSAMMLFRVPVGKMFYQGAPRLLASGVRVSPAAATATTAWPSRLTPPSSPAASWAGEPTSGTASRHARSSRAGEAGLRPGVRTLRESTGSPWRWRSPGAGEVRRGPGSRRPRLAAVRGPGGVGLHLRRDEDYGVPPECDPGRGLDPGPQLLRTEEAVD